MGRHVYSDWGFRYAYPYYGCYWPPAVVYYDYSYPTCYYPPIVYSSVVYTPIYAPTYYAEPIVPVVPTYYYPAYTLMYQNPSLYYAPPATSLRDELRYLDGLVHPERYQQCPRGSGGAGPGGQRLAGAAGS